MFYTTTVTLPTGLTSVAIGPPSVAIEAPQPEPPKAVPPPPETLWESEIGRQLQEDRQQIEQALASLGRAVRDLETRRVRQIADWRRAAAELAVTLAAQLVHDQIQAGDFPLESLAQELIASLVPTSGPVTVYFNPLDLPLLQNRLNGRPLVEGLDELTVQTDPALPRGDCRVESTDTVVLSQLEAQLIEMRRQLFRSLGHAGI